MIRDQAVVWLIVLAIVAVILGGGRYLAVAPSAVASSGQDQGVMALDISADLLPYGRRDTSKRLARRRSRSARS